MFGIIVQGSLLVHYWYFNSFECYTKLILLLSTIKHDYKL